MKSSIRFLSAFRRKPGTFRYNRSEPEQTSLHTAKRRGWLELQQKDWRRGPDSNRRIEVLQTSALPLGYRATSGGPWPMAQPPPGGGLEKPWSGRRDLNPRLRPWQGRTLPLSYSRTQYAILPPSRRRGQSPSRLALPVPRQLTRPAPRAPRAGTWRLPPAASD